MNAGYVKLILAALWLVPGVGLLACEWWTGRAIVALPLGTVRIPLSWVFLMFGGFNLLGGVQHTGGLFVEMKGGIADSPDFKFLVGYTFKKR